MVIGVLKWISGLSWVWDCSVLMDVKAVLERCCVTSLHGCQTRPNELGIGINSSNWLDSLVNSILVGVCMTYIHSTSCTQG